MTAPNLAPRFCLQDQFGQPKAAQPPKSAFGEDLISDKSLDEVILSYLAEDLDDKK